MSEHPLPDNYEQYDMFVIRHELWFRTEVFDNVQTLNRRRFIVRDSASNGDYIPTGWLMMFVSQEHAQGLMDETCAAWIRKRNYNTEGEPEA